MRCTSIVISISTTSPELTFGAHALLNGDALGEVSWAIDVEATEHPGVVREELQRYVRENGYERLLRLRDVEHIVNDVSYVLITLGDMCRRAP